MTNRKTIFIIFILKLSMFFQNLCFDECVIIEGLIFGLSNYALAVVWLVFSLTVTVYFLFEKSFLLYNLIIFFCNFFIFFQKFYVLTLLNILFFLNLIQLLFERFRVNFQLLFDPNVISDFGFVFL